MNVVTYKCDHANKIENCIVPPEERKNEDCLLCLLGEIVDRLQNNEEENDEEENEEEDEE